MAGNTGVRNELVSVCDEILRQEVITKDMYKTVMTKIKKELQKMLIVTNRGYKRKYVYGGSGIFDSIINFLREMLSQAGKRAASAALDVGSLVQQ